MELESKYKIVLNSLHQQYISNKNIYTLFINGSDYYLSKNKINTTCLHLSYLVEDNYLKKQLLKTTNYELKESNELGNIYSNDTQQPLELGSIYSNDTQQPLFVWWGGLNTNDYCIDSSTGASSSQPCTYGNILPACFKELWKNMEICKNLMNNKTVWYWQQKWDTELDVTNNLEYLNTFSNITTLIINGYDKTGLYGGTEILLNILRTFSFNHIKTIIWYEDEPWTSKHISNITTTFNILKTISNNTITIKTWINFMTLNFNDNCATIHTETCGYNKDLGGNGYSYKYIYDEIKNNSGINIDYVSIDYYFSPSQMQETYIAKYYNYNRMLINLITDTTTSLALVPSFNIINNANYPIDYNVMYPLLDHVKIISPWYIWQGPTANYWNFKSSKFSLDDENNDMVTLTDNSAYQEYNSLRLFIEHSGITYVDGLRTANRNQYNHIYNSNNHWNGPSIGKNAFNSPNYFYLPSGDNNYCCYQSTHCDGAIDYNKPKGGGGNCSFNYTRINNQPVKAVYGYKQEYVKNGEYIYIIENNKCYSVSHSCYGYIPSDCSNVITPIDNKDCFPGAPTPLS